MLNQLPGIDKAVKHIDFTTRSAMETCKFPLHAA
jgi:hypothetical protein